MDLIVGATYIAKKPSNGVDVGDHVTICDIIVGVFGKTIHTRLIKNNAQHIWSELVFLDNFDVAAHQIYISHPNVISAAGGSVSAGNSSPSKGGNGSMVWGNWSRALSGPISSLHIKSGQKWVCRKAHGVLNAGEEVEVENVPDADGTMSVRDIHQNRFWLFEADFKDSFEIRADAEGQPVPQKEAYSGQNLTWDPYAEYSDKYSTDW